MAVGRAANDGGPLHTIWRQLVPHPHKPRRVSGIGKFAPLRIGQHKPTAGMDQKIGFLLPVPPKVKLPWRFLFRQLAAKFATDIGFPHGSDQRRCSEIPGIAEAHEKTA